MNTIFSRLQLFDGLKESRGLDIIVNQCQVISGDCSLPDLGVSDEDRQLLKERVSMVYHCAATVRFDESLKKAVLLNTRGTKLMLEMCKTFDKLDVRKSDEKRYLFPLFFSFLLLYTVSASFTFPMKSQKWNRNRMRMRMKMNEMERIMNIFLMNFLI